MKTLKGHKARVLSIAFSPDRKELVSGSQDKIRHRLGSGDRRNALFASAAAGLRRRRQRLPGRPTARRWPPAPARTFAVSGTPKRAACCKRSADIRDRCLKSTFSPDGKMLATGGEDGLVKLWDVATGELLRTYDCQSGKVLCVRFSPDGKSFVTTGRDGPARLWWVLPPETK